ncbi:hypothetical protein CF70_013805 [Cupriavidus sp. SK-3]|nr:hypothetical protein [Cupriavidus sp. SK-3]KDP85459.1 hypothetical protein CF70_013805 [Cupriavidus sp. SK-3]
MLDKKSLILDVWMDMEHCGLQIGVVQLVLDDLGVIGGSQKVRTGRMSNAVTRGGQAKLVAQHLEEVADAPVTHIHP